MLSKTMLFAALIGGFLFGPCSMSPNICSAQGWEQRGIGGGGALFSPTISPFDGNQLYMATDLGGVYRSENFGAKWETVPFTQLRGGIETQVRFTSDPNVLYSTRRGNFQALRLPVRSNDGGQTFSPLASNPTNGNAYSVQVDPNNTERLLISDQNSLYYSSNGGSSFSNVYTTTDLTNGLHVAGAFWDGDDIYVGTSSGLLTSSNGGINFGVDTASGIPSNEAFVSFSGAKTGNLTRFYGVTYAKNNVQPGIVGGVAANTGNQPRVYRKNAGASNWLLVRDDIDANQGFFISTSLDNTNVAYLAGTNTSTGTPTILKTTNGGISWNSVFNTAGNQNISTGSLGSGGDLGWGWAGVPMGFSVAPNNPNRAIVTDFGVVHVTDDGGTTWKQAYVDPAYENPAGSPTPKGSAYASSGVDPTSVWSIAWASPYTLVASFTDIQGARSTDGGDTWTSGAALGLPLNSTYQVIGNNAGNRLYAATSSVHDMYQSTRLTDATIDGGTGRIMQSSDEGASWQTLYDFGMPVVWLANDPAQPERMYASVVNTADGGIYVTNNLSTGANFTKLPSPARTEGRPFNIRVLDNGDILASWSGRIDGNGSFTESSGVFLSTDGGNTWLDRSDPNMRRWTKDIVVDPHDATQDTWYAAVFSHWGSFPNQVGGLYRTTDRGQSWAELGNFFRVESITVDPMNADIAYVTTEAEGLWKTENLTASQPTFVLDETYPFDHPTRVFYNPYNPEEIWITSFGNGMRVLNTATTAAGDYDKDGDIDQADYMVWESTFGSTTNLDADGNGDGVVDAADYTVWRDSYSAAAAAVPEPATFALALLGMANWGARRRRE